MEYKNKYDMTREENVEYAKRNVVDYIYESAKLEGLTVTFPDTDDIYNGIVPTNGDVSVKDILVINNLKHTWDFLFSTLDVPNDYAYVCKINQFIGDGHLFQNAGYIRQLDVRIGGTTWKPNIPTESVVKETLTGLSKIKNPIDRSLSTMLYLMRGQLFFDGNKRTAMSVANKIMIENGMGIITVSPSLRNEFGEQLVSFYESNEPKAIKKFLYNKCIDGTDFTKDRIADRK